MIFSFSDLHILKLLIFTSSVFTPEIIQVLPFSTLRNPNLQSSKKTGTPPTRPIDHHLIFSVVNRPSSQYIWIEYTRNTAPTVFEVGKLNMGRDLQHGLLGIISMSVLPPGRGF